MKIKSILKFFPYFLFLYHLGFAWLAYDYVNQNNGDAVKYWFVGRNMEKLEWLSFFQPGTEMVKFITYPFVKYLHLPGWAGCILFSAFSGWGFLKLWKLLKAQSHENQNLLLFSMFLLLLPNAHFWTSLIGKEALLFVPVVWILSEILKKKYFSIFLILSFFFIAWIRPHVAFVFFIAYGIALIWKGEFSLRIKAGIGAVSVLGIGILYFLLGKITRSQIPLTQKIENLYAAHNFKLKGTSGYVPLEEYSYPYKMFTFYFRPFPMEKTNLYSQIIGLENLVFFILFLSILYVGIRKFKTINWNVFHLFSVLVLIFYGSMFAYGYANFGMIIRAKALVFPIILVFSISILSQWKSQSNSN